MILTTKAAGKSATCSFKKGNCEIKKKKVKFKKFSSKRIRKRNPFKYVFFFLKKELL